jgi:hypothetical protein
MAEETITRVSRWADSSWKILTIIAAIVIFIYEASALYMMVYSNQAKIEIIEKEFKTEVELINDRADKRYLRATEMYEELKTRGLTLNKEYEQHLVQDAYFKGRTDQALEYLKSK